MIKVLGAVIVMASSSIVGILYSKTFGEKLNQVRDAEYALRALESEITYTSTPLVQALHNVSKKGKSGVYDLFSSMSEVLRGRDCNSVHEAFEKAYELNKEGLLFDAEEKDVLSSFMQSLGGSDTEGQKKNFNITIKKFEMFDKKCAEVKTKNEKLYRYLGLCVGALIVIILI